MNELPQIIGYTTTTNTGTTAGEAWTYSNVSPLQVGKIAFGQAQGITTNYEISDIEKEEIEMNRRLVRVIIVDPDDRVPLENALLYQGEEQFTDLTDEELFFELEIKQILEKHNSRRVEILDKENSVPGSRDVYLEPARIRELKMVVITIAEF